MSEAVERGRRVLFEEREKRIKPGRDEKVITAWNGLMLESFAEAATVLGRADYREIAERKVATLQQKLDVRHRWKTEVGQKRALR